MEAEGEILQDYYELKDCHTHFIGQDCWVERVYVPDTDPGSGSGGGGSGSSGSHGGGNEPDGGYESPVCPDCNHSPCVCVRTGNCDTIHAPLLNSLYAQFKNAGLEEKFIDLYKGEANEWASELYDSAGVVFMTPPHTDGKPSGVSVTLITSDKRKALATIHNHPSGNGPSVVDAMSLAKSFYKSGLKSIYVCAPDGRLYSLTVTQPNAVFTFYRTYSDSIGMEGMKRMLDSYMNMLKEYDGLNYKVQTSSLYALSAVLHVLSSGIEVMEGQMIKGHMEFNIRKGEMVNIETERIIRRSTCY